MTRKDALELIKEYEMAVQRFVVTDSHEPEAHLVEATLNYQRERVLIRLLKSDS